MSNWQTEIEDLHAFFEAYFLGVKDSLDRVQAALASNFSIVGPTGTESDRAETIQAIEAGHGKASGLRIWVTDCRSLYEDESVLAATYIEHQELGDGQSTQRRSTVLFAIDAAGPNGLRWHRVHETWTAENNEIPAN